MEKILRNAIQCKSCGQVIESRSVHEFVMCRCGDCAVDGGLVYLRRCYREEGCYIDLSETVEIPDGEEAK